MEDSELLVRGLNDESEYEERKWLKQNVDNEEKENADNNEHEIAEENNDNKEENNSEENDDGEENDDSEDNDNDGEDVSRFFTGILGIVHLAARLAEPSIGSARNNYTNYTEELTVASGDKFGNIWIVRCPENISTEADDLGSEGLPGREYLHGAPNRLTLTAHFFTQDVPTSISKTNLATGGQDILIWTDLQGTIGVLIPFVAREDANFFQTLGIHMRSEDPPLTGRDYLMYRGYYVPVKGVIDGDLCE
ncbi:CPSF A subunit region-domain-containing protein [Annulohypoxylon bovei var. microspora]|nr:CPSF A subunit region-domain-containing protein [Annulohypoxylon bovei var. microspora]